MHWSIYDSQNFACDVMENWYAAAPEPLYLCCISANTFSLIPWAYSLFLMIHTQTESDSGTAPGAGLRKYGCSSKRSRSWRQKVVGDAREDANLIVVPFYPRSSFFVSNFNRHWFSMKGAKMSSGKSDVCLLVLSKIKKCSVGWHVGTFVGTCIRVDKK